MAQERLTFHSASGYKYSGERGASKEAFSIMQRGFTQTTVRGLMLYRMAKKFKIAFVRRGYSPSGGAETYLKRLAHGIVDAGHEVQLISGNQWPSDDWPFGSLRRLRANSVIGFADELENIRPQLDCDFLFSLERVWSCDIYRAGDGVHRAWLTRRRKFEVPLKQFVRTINRKHRDILQLEESLFAHRRAKRVIVASQMVQDEIRDLYGYPANQIEIIRNGIPIDKYRFDLALRTKSREDLKLRSDQIALLFAGSGWDRKGLLFAIQAMALCRNKRLRLLVAGRGNERFYKTKRLRFWLEEPVRFLGEVADLTPMYAAADIFILPTIYDPFSNACLEALACGLPVITTRSNGFSEIIEDGMHGSIVEHAGNLVALRDAIRFWSDSTCRAAAREPNVRRASQFDISTNVQQTLDGLKEVASA
jgi:UDP-glucose:(heptosyl)LPS alpha-1,3-glucosyltransferase